MSLNLADPFLIFFLFLVWIAGFYTGSAKNYCSCPLDNILSSDEWISSQSLSLLLNNQFYPLASCPLDNFIQWIALSSILNNRAQVIFFNESHLGLFKLISDYLPYFEEINIFFNIIAKKFELIYKDWSKLFVRFIRNNLNQVVHTLS